MREAGMKLANAKSGSVYDIVAPVEDVMQRAYALGRSDAMKRSAGLAHADAPGLRAVALLGPAELSQQAAQASLEAPVEAVPVIEGAPLDAAPARHAALVEAHQAVSEGQPPALAIASPAAAAVGRQLLGKLLLPAGVEEVGLTGSAQEPRHVD